MNIVFLIALPSITNNSLTLQIYRGRGLTLIQMTMRIGRNHTICIEEFMAKTLGCKVDVETYTKVASLGPISSVLRVAIEHYIRHHSQMPINVVNSDVEGNDDANDCQSLIWQLEAVIQRYKKGNNRKPKDTKK